MEELHHIRRQRWMLIILGFCAVTIVGLSLVITMVSLVDRRDTTEIALRNGRRLDEVNAEMALVREKLDSTRSRDLDLALCQARIDAATRAAGSEMFAALGAFLLVHNTEQGVRTEAAELEATLLVYRNAVKDYQTWVHLSAEDRFPCPAP